MRKLKKRILVRGASRFRLISDRASPQSTSNVPALVEFLTHRIRHRNGEQRLAVRAFNLCLSGKSTGKADLVHQKVLKE